MVKNPCVQPLVNKQEAKRKRAFTNVEYGHHDHKLHKILCLTRVSMQKVEGESPSSPFVSSTVSMYQSMDAVIV